MRGESGDVYRLFQKNILVFLRYMMYYVREVIVMSERVAVISIIVE